MYNNHSIFFLLLISFLIGENYKYTEIESIPDLSFVNEVNLDDNYFCLTLLDQDSIILFIVQPLATTDEVPKSG